MQIDINAWIFGKLMGNAPLVALLSIDPATSTPNIVFSYPQALGLLPCVSYEEMNQFGELPDFRDDAQYQVESLMQIDVWTGDESPTVVREAVDVIMVGLLYVCFFSKDVPEPNTRIRHRVMRYRRRVTPAELV